METLTLLSWAFDVTLGLTLMWLAWRALASEDLFKGIVLFIAFGLLMALAWVRLDAPDIALAEAAIGAGLTGALLLGALAKLEAGAESRSRRPEILPRSADKAKVFSGLLVFLLLALVVMLVYAIVKLPPLASGLSAQVAENITASGVSNPVTATLLNFRAYDTLLEMAVLLLAVLGIRSLAVVQEPRGREPGAVLDMLSHLLVPLLILVSGYLLWVGSYAAGGAFQAGAVLAATGVLLLLTGWLPGAWFVGWPLRFLLIFGLAVFVAVTLVLQLFGASFLEFPPSLAGSLILLIEAAAALSIGVTLTALFLGGRPQPEPPSSGRAEKRNTSGTQPS